jgi:hypothetical protein
VYGTLFGHFTFRSPKSSESPWFGCLFTKLKSLVTVSTIRHPPPWLQFVSCTHSKQFLRATVPRICPFYFCGSFPASRHAAFMYHDGAYMTFDEHAFVMEMFNTARSEISAKARHVTIIRTWTYRQ